MLLPELKLPKAPMQLMEIEIASRIMKNVVLPEIGLALEICPNLGPNVFLGEYSDKGVSAQYLRPNIYPIYQGG